MHIASCYYLQQGSTLYYKPQNSHQISAQLRCAGMGGWMILCQCGPTFMRKIYNFYTNCFVFSVTIVQHSMCLLVSPVTQNLWLRVITYPRIEFQETQKTLISLPLLLNCHFLFALSQSYLFRFHFSFLSLFIFLLSRCFFNMVKNLTTLVSFVVLLGFF